MKTVPKVSVATVGATGDRYLVRHRFLPRTGPAGPEHVRVVLWGDVVGWRGLRVSCEDGGPSLSLRQVAVEEVAAGPALWSELFEQTLRHRREAGRVLAETAPGHFAEFAAGDVERLRRIGVQLLAAADAENPLAALLRLKIGF